MVLQARRRVPTAFLLQLSLNFATSIHGLAATVASVACVNGRRRRSCDGFIAQLRPTAWRCCMATKLHPSPGGAATQSSCCMGRAREKGGGRRRGRPARVPTGDEDGRRGHRPATRALRCCFKLGAGCLAALGTFSFSEENDSREGRNTGTDVTALSACIGRLKLDRPNCWAGAPAPSVPPRY